MTEALSPWFMPPIIIAGRLSRHNSLSAIFTQSTGVPLHDHISPPGHCLRFFSDRGVVAEKAHEKPLRADSGAQTSKSPNSPTMPIRLAKPFEWYPSSFEISIKGLLRSIKNVLFWLQKYEKRFIGRVFSYKIYIFANQITSVMNCL